MARLFGPPAWMREVQRDLKVLSSAADSLWPATLFSPAERAPRRPVPSVVSETDRLADDLARELGQTPCPTIKALSITYRSRLERLGHVRSDSQPSSCLRRMQAFLHAHVYGKRIPLAALPARIQEGLRSPRPRQH